jgi:hypothetical protein
MTKNEVLDFIKKYHNPEHKSLMTGIPITDENMKKINFVKRDWNTSPSKMERSEMENRIPYQDRSNKSFCLCKR